MDTKGVKIPDENSSLSLNFPGASPTLDKWRNALAEPKAVLGKSAAKGNMNEDARWLRDNSEKYTGKWIALKDGKLLGAHESRVKLRQSLKQNSKLQEAMFFKL